MQQKIGAQYGTYFALITLFLLCGGFYLYAAGYLSHKPRMEVADGGRELRISPIGSHYYLSGTLNGEPVTFLLDTGASSVAVSENVAASAGLKHGYRVETSTANGTAAGYQTRIEVLTAGPISMKDVPALILPNMDDEVLLGMNFLRHVNWRQQDGVLIIELPQHSL